MGSASLHPPYTGYSLFTEPGHKPIFCHSCETRNPLLTESGHKLKTDSRFHRLQRELTRTE
ncbi:Uncharacterized protein dnm_040340 [Desulfonema magnum]|uniref:Uncharacterized protein n=1 Tax=Desulfonema magnum TaxID=45655 RepID=A0A975BLP9_9BACT|nr:Uncharacterized protein dnm_040340 [Desulfonema magnum]